MDPITKLNKILQLEHDQGFQDRAVIGGLERYTVAWRLEAEQVYGAGPHVENIIQRLSSYSALKGGAARHQALKELQTILSAFQATAQSPAALEAQPASPALEPAVDEAPTLDVGEVEPAVVRNAESAESAESAEEPETPPPANRGRPQSAARSVSAQGLDSSVTVLRGVGPRQAERMANLGLHTIRDMLTFLPRRYDDYSKLKTINRLEYGEEVTIIATVWDAGTRRTRGGATIFRALLSDGSSSIEATWFNQAYLADKITRGSQIVISGKVDEYLGRLCFNSPQWELLDRELLHTGRIVPVYPLTEGITGKWLQRLMKRTVDFWAARLPDPIPASVQQQEQLLDLATALQQAHFPDNYDTLSLARQRLAFDELFVLQVGILRQRRELRAGQGRPLHIDDQDVATLTARLPYPLTGAQERSLTQIVRDLRTDHPMNRLLQGDVGSGKTVVAAAAQALCVAAGSQTAMMAPTSILAEQHYATLTRLFGQLSDEPPAVRLLTGNTPAAERAAVLEGLQDGSVQVLVGTHALIQEDVVFRDLAFIVIDEQHRFGVRQRAALRQKGSNPHLLVMTATPIPRSLELTVWGHLDVSLIDEMPPGRQPIVTRMVLPTEREHAYNFVRSQVEKGRQVFVICPLVEESDKVEAKAAVEEYERLQRTVFPHLRLGLLHGRMKGDEKETVMGQFVRGEMDILVSTSVVEVGVDVPNATVMMIEGAERFGLAQLHQFRGRVGRGEHDSYCLLVAAASTPEATERLKVVESTNDGFALAQKDLEMRGPGEFLGTRQSGLPALRLAELADVQLLERAREAARRFVESDPDLLAPESRLLATRVATMWGGEGDMS